MKIDITEIKDNLGAMMNTAFALEAEDRTIQGQKISIIEPSNLELKVINSEGEYVIIGTVFLSLQVVCSRCLKEFKTTLEFEVKGEVSKTEVEDAEIDISTILTEHIRLAVPMKYVCDEECKGLCPNCGRNLNQEDCDCIMHKVDPRLAKLEKLLPDEE
ncbi:YceD family protein [Natroniella sp. ANB-PHB2]|uniref:YceD family protein n=1 Tax=Natroniella sp. ANB-PHB2 TaxID=3384444 RepID=UPI0038D367F2